MNTPPNPDLPAAGGQASSAAPVPAPESTPPTAPITALELDEVVRKIRELPVLPAVVIDLLESFSEEDIDLHTLANKVSHDQALAAKTLRFANSAFFAAHARVASITQAISLLGVHAVRGLVTAAAMAASIPERPCPGFDYTAFWRHGVASAVCSRTIARHLHLNQDTAFIAGLLHDVGRLVLVSCFTRQYEAVLAYQKQHDCHTLAAERAVLGIDHAEAGRLLAEHWRFPLGLIVAIAEHHAPQERTGAGMAQLVHVANAVVHALDLTGDGTELVPPIWDSAWYALDFPRETWLSIMHETELEFGEMNRVA